MNTVKRNVTELKNMIQAACLLMELQLFAVELIDRTGAESLIPTQESNEIIQGVGEMRACVLLADSITS